MRYAVLTVMTHLLVMTLLSAAPNPQLVLQAPTIEKLSSLNSFLDLGGEQTAFLRRETWRDDGHPLLRVDFTRAETVTAAGLELKGFVRVMVEGDLKVTCVALADVKKYEAACAERLKTLGTIVREAKDGVTTVFAKDAINRVLSGYVLKGKESCALVAQGRTVEQDLPVWAKQVGKPLAPALLKQAANLPGVLFTLNPRGAVGFSTKDKEPFTLVADARSGALPIARVSGPGPSPYAATAMTGLLVAKLRFAPESVKAQSAQVATLLSQLLPKGAAPSGVLSTAANEVAATLTGQGLLFVREVKVGSTLRTWAGRFFAPKFAALLESRDPAKTRALLSALAAVKGAKALDNGEGYSVLVKEGEVKLGLRGTHLYFGNDGAAVEQALKAAKAGQQAHGLEFTVDPTLVARGMQQVPLLDAVQTPELAAVLAASSEAGPLLVASESVTGWADPEGSGYRAHSEWKLKAPPSVDAGVADGGR